MYRARLDLGFDSIDMTAATVRKLTAYALVAYPVGSLLRVHLGDDSFLGAILGGFLTLSALLIGFLIFGTRFYKVVAADDAPLDEYEMSLRRAAIADAYTLLSSLLSSLLVVALCYTYFALEFGLWLPDRADAWQRIAAGLGLLVLVLPIAMLVWSGKVDEHADEGDEA
jgi:hypothetical protein